MEPLHLDRTCVRRNVVLSLAAVNGSREGHQHDHVGGDEHQGHPDPDRQDGLDLWVPQLGTGRRGLVPPLVGHASRMARRATELLSPRRCACSAATTSRFAGAPRGGPCCSRTGSAATRTCGGSWPPPSRTSTASCSSTTWGRAVRTSPATPRTCSSCAPSSTCATSCSSATR